MITSGCRRGVGRPTQLWVAASAVVGVLLVSACSSGSAVDAMSIAQAERAIDVPAESHRAPVPPITERPEPTGVPAPDRRLVPDPPAVATMDAAAPVRLRIPSIGVDSELVDLGLEPDGTLQVPSGGFPAGWYTGAPTPGELGPAIIVGHVDWGGRPGVFFDLRELSPGDQMAITRQDGRTARFNVTRIDRFAKDAFPTQAVYGDLDHAGLRLITCGGGFDRRTGSYEDNLVVFAELAGGDEALAADMAHARS